MVTTDRAGRLRKAAPHHGHPFSAERDIMHRAVATSDSAEEMMPQLWELEGATDTVYRAILRRPGVRVDDLQASLQIGQGEFRQALRTLSDLALIHNSWERAGDIHPVSPQLGFQALLARKQGDIARQQLALEETRAQLGSMVDHYMVQFAAARGMGVERIHGAATVRMRTRQLMSVTERELMVLAPDGPPGEGGGPMSEPLTETMLSRPIGVRAVFPERVCRARGPEGRSPEPAQRPAEYRTVPELSICLRIADRRTALVQLNSEDPLREALVIEEPAMVAILVSFFETVWFSAVPLSAATRGEALSPQHLELLHLLGEGLTDEAAARRMGISLRTERRMLTKLSQCLNAQSRFQLGQRVAEHRLL
ncbi:TrmB family transcriptional regulator [Streptomyces sp. NPDC050256]|uniref:TrmB family transcriptional regulator n=1 Tax=unclassified Streptomyces TaxID=2593676 RepID=UPI00379F0294